MSTKSKVIRLITIIGLTILTAGLTKAGSYLGLLNLDASTVAFATIVLGAVIQAVTQLEKRLEMGDTIDMLKAFENLPAEVLKDLGKPPATPAAPTPPAAPPTQ